MAVLAGVMAFSPGATAQTAPPQTAPAPAENAAPTADDAVMLTAFLKHDLSRPSVPAGWRRCRELVCDDGSWPSGDACGCRHREVNRILETTAGGSYRTGFQPTYDYK